jgi:hypothetical protein
MAVVVRMHRAIQETRTFPAADRESFVSELQLQTRFNASDALPNGASEAQSAASSDSVSPYVSGLRSFRLSFWRGV